MRIGLRRDECAQSDKRHWHRQRKCESPRGRSPWTEHDRQPWCGAAARGYQGRAAAGLIAISARNGKPALPSVRTAIQAQPEITNASVKKTSKGSVRTEDSAGCIRRRRRSARWQVSRRGRCAPRPSRAARRSSRAITTDSGRVAASLGRDQCARRTACLLRMRGVQRRHHGLLDLRAGESFAARGQRLDVGVATA